MASPCKFVVRRNGVEQGRFPATAAGFSKAASRAARHGRTATVSVECGAFVKYAVGRNCRVGACDPFASSGGFGRGKR